MRRHGFVQEKTSSGKVEIKTYQRDGNSFKKLGQFGKSSFGILKENRKFIILVQTYDYDAIFVTFLSKENDTFTEDYLTPNVKLSAKNNAW